jgi:hypothetical protein
MHLISAGINTAKAAKPKTCDWQEFGFFSASSNPTKVPYDVPLRHENRIFDHLPAGHLNFPFITRSGTVFRRL